MVLYWLLDSKVVGHRHQATWEDRQRDQELLEHKHEEEAPPSGHRPHDASAKNRPQSARDHARLTDSGQPGKLDELPG